MLVTKVDNKMYLNLCMWALWRDGWRHRCGWCCLPEHGLCVLRADPSPQTPFRDRSAWMLPHPQLSFCLWHLILGLFQLFTMDEANTRKAITGSQKQKKVRLILFCDSTGQRRGTREVGGGRQPGEPGSLGRGNCLGIWVWRKVNTRNQWVKPFSKHWNGNDASPGSLALPGPAKCVSCLLKNPEYPQDDKIHSGLSGMPSHATVKGLCTVVFNTSTYFPPWRFPFPFLPLALGFAFLRNLTVKLRGLLLFQQEDNWTKTSNWQMDKLRPHRKHWLDQGHTDQGSRTNTGLPAHCSSQDTILAVSWQSPNRNQSTNNRKLLGE